MKNGKAFSVICLTAAAIMLAGCEQAIPADETQIEQPAAIIKPTAIPDTEADEPEKELIAIHADEPEKSIVPDKALSAQETSPPTSANEMVTAPTARPVEAKSSTETAVPTATPRPTAEAMLVETANVAPTEAPRPTATPKPTSSPKATTAPVITVMPRPTATPAPVATPKPTAAPTQTPVPTATPHVHGWTMHEATGHYESRKVGTEEVAVGTYWEEIGGWDENRAAYYKCNDCGAEFTLNLDAGDHILSAYHSSYSYYPAETIHHDGEWVERTRHETREVYEDVWVVDSEAYWTCDCGETRYSQP